MSKTRVRVGKDWLGFDKWGIESCLKIFEGGENRDLEGESSRSNWVTES